MPDTILARPVPGTGAPGSQATPTKPAADAETPALAHEEVGLLAPLYPLPRLELVEGQGAHVKDAGGREYLDFTSGIAVNAFGHAPRGLAEALVAQMARLGHCSNLFANSPALSLARELSEATGYDRVFFCNPGTEGLDAALKFGRARARAGATGPRHPGVRGRLPRSHRFALSATFNPSYREPFEPLIPGVRFAPFNDVSALNAVLDRDVCVVAVECVQGESGAVPGTRDFLQALRARTTALGAALVIDEVQTGMGRTGRLLAQEHFEIRADITVMSKALGAGLPIAAVLMTEDVAKTLAPGMHGCTFGEQSCLCCRGAVGVGPGQASRVPREVRQGAPLTAGLEALAAKHAAVREARGLGLLRAIELAPGTIEPAALVAAAREAGLLLVRGGERAVRVPPLTVTDAEIDDGLARLDAALVASSLAGARRNEEAQGDARGARVSAASTPASSCRG
jgi:acetylornithine/succinyldiaminopimelate/putrescine aminotransferase